MNLYLDDNITDRRLVVQLRQARHDVVIPTEAGQDGASDATHWTYAIHQNRILLTQDVNDFTDLHDLILAALVGIIRACCCSTPKMIPRAT